MCLEQVPYSLSVLVRVQSSMVGGNSRIWMCLLDRSGALACSLPLWVRLTSAQPVRETTFRDPRTTFHNPNTSWWYGLLGIQMGITELSAAVLPGSLHLALTWAPGWLLHTCPGQACICVDPSPSNQHTCRAHQPYVSSPHPLVATTAPPPGICREKIR